MKRVTLRQLEYFLAAGECGSIALASARVNVSSPSISAAIAQLEQEFGLPLFVRQRAQGLSPTLAGRRMMDQARVILREVDGLSDIAGDITGVVRGPLSIGCMLSLAQVVLPALRRGFEAAYPEARVRQFELNQAEIFARLRRAEIDVALSYDMDIPADLQFVPLQAMPPYVLLAADHPLAGAGSLRIEDLRDLPMVLLDLPMSSDYFLSLFAAEGAKPMVAERTRDMSVMRSLVANGYGYSIVNIRAAAEQSADGRALRYVPLAGEVRHIRLGLLMVPEADRSGTVGAFVAHSKAQVAGPGLPGLEQGGKEQDI